MEHVRYTKNMSILVRPEGDEMLLFNPIRRSIHFLSASAYECWLHCDDERNFTRFLEAHSFVQDDVQPMLEALRIRGLVHATHIV
jgi:hypothetical protein